MDYYGDGVRALIFRRDIFPRHELPALQAMLVGEHGAFTILCIVMDDILDGDSESGGSSDFLALFSTRMLVTRRLANELSTRQAG